MTNAEHLIDNAIERLECGKDFEDFVGCPINRVMAESIGINPRYVWEMARYVYCCIKPLWEDEVKE